MGMVGLSREIITPPVGAALCGYFTPRVSRGVFDDLQVRVMVAEHNGVATGLAVADLLFVGTDLTAAVRAGLRKAGLAPLADAFILSATHTHTGPYPFTFWGQAPHPGAVDSIVNAVVRAATRAWQGRAPATWQVLSTHDNAFAFNRRYRMADGRVETNPSKKNPSVLAVEDGVDNQVSLLAIRHEGRLSGVVANIVNHNDTLGGDLISADWPGRMERAVQEGLGSDLPVITLIGCSGNVNHLDLHNPGEQTGQSEMNRIGRGYGALVLRMLENDTSAPLPWDRFAVRGGTVTVATRDIPAADLAKAEALLARAPTDNGVASRMGDAFGGAEDNGAIERFFARQLLAYHQTREAERPFPFTVWRVGDRFGLATLPGEPFTQIGLRIKKESPCAITMVASLAMGSCGYVPMPEAFAGGGYETFPVVGGGAQPDTASRLTTAIRTAWPG